MTTDVLTAEEVEVFGYVSYASYLIGGVFLLWWSGDKPNTEHLLFLIGLLCALLATVVAVRTGVGLGLNALVLRAFCVVLAIWALGLPLAHFALKQHETAINAFGDRCKMQCRTQLKDCRRLDKPLWCKMQLRGASCIDCCRSLRCGCAVGCPERSNDRITDHRISRHRIQNLFEWLDADRDGFISREQAELGCRYLGLAEGRVGLDLPHDAFSGERQICDVEGFEEVVSLASFVAGIGIVEGEEEQDEDEKMAVLEE